MRTKSRVLGALLALAVGAAPLTAQESEAPGAQYGADPLAVVAQFLSLAPEQVQALALTLQQRDASVAPVLVEIAQREQRIQELIASGGDPAEIGRIVVEIHHLRQVVQTALVQFLAQFQSLLNPEQRQRWEHVRLTAQLLPVLPAFHGLGLL
jgi:hypothetical protein